MAVYKIFPEKDTTLYSKYPTMNTGIDAINQISNLNFAVDSFPSIARTLLKFDSNEIDDVIENVIGSNNYETYLKSFIATAQGIVESSTLEIWPVAVSSTDSSLEWNQGTGTYLDQPLTTDGACWESPFFAAGDTWEVNAGNGITGSYNPTYSVPGGGTWYTGSTSTPTFNINETFGPRTDKDLDINVTSIVQAWTGSEIPNHGFILKWEDNLEFNTSKLVQPVMQYYSVDTNTIYPPILEFRWDDSVWDTGSSTMGELSGQQLYLSVAENPGVFYSESINRFRINARYKYPQRVYQTGSLYTTNSYLPSGSAWYAIKDLDTNEYIVAFDDNYTKLSADFTSSYFDLHMDGFEPERYYKILIKVNSGGSTTVYDGNHNFKIVNG